MTYTNNKILKNVSYSHKVDFLTTEKLAGFKMKSWQVFKQKVGRFYPKSRVPPLIQKFIAGLDAPRIVHVVNSSYVSQRPR